MEDTLGESIPSVAPPIPSIDVAASIAAAIPEGISVAIAAAIAEIPLISPALFEAEERNVSHGRGGGCNDQTWTPARTHIVWRRIWVY